MHTPQRFTAIACLTAVLLATGPVAAAVLEYGDEDALGTGVYGASDPKAGATLEGLAAGVVTFASNTFGHSFPFAPIWPTAGCR